LPNPCLEEEEEEEEEEEDDILKLGTRWRWVVSFTPRPL
jgi:hypothetical protein